MQSKGTIIYWQALIRNLNSNENLREIVAQDIYAHEFFITEELKQQV